MQDLDLSLLLRAGVLGIVCLSALPFGAAEKSSKLDEFARCLAQKKATMYGAFFCVHCKEQRDLFGDSFQYVPYVECVEKGARKETEQCKALGIRFTPTWIFESTSQRVDGKVLSLEELSKRSGCRLP